MTTDSEKSKTRPRVKKRGKVAISGLKPGPKAAKECTGGELREVRGGTGSGRPDDGYAVGGRQ